MQRLLKTFTALSLLLFVSACGHLVVQTPPASCAKLIPDSWRAGVGPGPIPAAVPADFGAAACASVIDAARPYCMLAQRAQEGEKRYAGAYVTETGQTAKADGRTADTIGIFERCEALVNAARPRQ